ncbi:unnamed protein product [Lactuca saligna]|uniref:Protein kinase domain-containing protein n=1 Tax=Lactuca saligna TaxID=75948 RepID=A0AA36EG25_LACSI|nr:unnamed protein product [Lactuca saligna]
MALPELASSSSSPIDGHTYTYDVFLCFRGVDTRYNFTDHLNNALVAANITTFFSDEKIEMGVDLKPDLESAIKASRASVIVLSINFAASTWCLDELVLILEQRRISNHIVVPIFYHVEPIHVRKLQSSFENAMAMHSQRMEMEIDTVNKSHRAQKIDGFKKALAEVANLKGMLVYGDKRESEVIQDIVKDLKRRLNLSSMSSLPQDVRFHPELVMCRMKQPNHPEIPLQAIKYCTDDFNEKNMIGKGGFGKVYKGILTWGDHVNKPVTVKRLEINNNQGNKEFNTELKMLSQYRHHNIVTLIGFCNVNNDMILVYEYASNGSLDKHLLNPSSQLSWLQLLKICIDVASALEYLHNHVAKKHRIIHRDIKSANILLDENWNAKLADFGLAKIGLANQQNSNVITNVAGTFGYIDPQYGRTGFLTKESDVYSFGVVLFEVLCGRVGCVDYNDERKFLFHYAPTCYKNGDMEKIVDQRIRKDINPITLLKFSATAYQCLQETREHRPTIDEVVFQLKEAMKIQLEDENL